MPTKGKKKEEREGWREGDRQILRVGQKQKQNTTKLESIYKRLNY